MATLASRLGAAGVITDGGVRDLQEVRALGLHYFAPYPVVSHGNFEIVAVGKSIRLDGEEVRPGDLLHGDLNGIVIVPPDLLPELPQAVDRVRAREKRLMQYVTGPDFTLAGAREISGY
jgi:regulator of RNase E activity RraA